jgi:hypothetical protein
MGRLAMVQQTVIDEMFEPFFEELPILAKDKKLHTVLFRSIIALGSRSEYLNSLTAELALNLQQSESEAAIKLGETLYDELTSAYFQDLLKNKNN